MRRHAAAHGHHLSVRALLDALAGIEEALLIYPDDRGRPKARRIITDMDPAQQHLFDLFDLFDLTHWAPTR